MSSPERRREQRRERADADRARDVEYDRKQALNMWERIEELDGSAELKDILHRIARGEREDE